MPLVKEHSAATNAHEAIVLDLGDLRKQADRLKADARAEADRIVAEARAEAARLTARADERGHAEGYARGHAEGVEAGRAEGRAQALADTAEQFDRLHANWRAAIGPWEARRAEMLDEVRRSLFDFALRLAARVTKRVPAVDPAVVVDQVEAALAQMARSADARVRVHPEDRALVEEAAPTLVRDLELAERIDIVEDEAIERGGCVVVYGRGRIDATIDGQLDRIVQTLLPEPTDNVVDGDGVDTDADADAGPADPADPGDDEA